MHRSIALLLTCWVSLSLQIVLAKSSAEADAHLARRTPAAGRLYSGTEVRRSLLGRQFAGESYSSAVVSLSSASSATVSGGGISESYVSAGPSMPAVASPAVAPALPPVSSAPTCDKTNTKAEINRFLVQCEATLKKSTTPIIACVQTVNQSNVAELAPQIATHVKEILRQLKLSLSYVQLCGMDAKPLSNDQGVAISDVSWSAFQVVLTLKDIYHSISGLYKPFPVMKQQCSDTLMAISTALASLIGACGEQINLFDTRFFPLVTPQLKEFSDLADDFVSFIGDFTS